MIEIMAKTKSTSKAVPGDTLTSAAITIGSTLGGLAKRVGLAVPKKSAAKAPATKKALPKKKAAAKSAAKKVATKRPAAKKKS